MLKRKNSIEIKKWEYNISKENLILLLTKCNKLVKMIKMREYVDMMDSQKDTKEGSR